MSDEQQWDAALPEAAPAYTLIDRLKAVTGLSVPVALGVALRLWTVLAGLVTIHFITAHLSALVQGYWYTFNSLTQLTQLVDLGLQILVVQFASHEAAHLIFGRQGKTEGPAPARARLASIGRFSLTWFGLLGIVLVGGLIAAGYVMFSDQPGAPEWRSPWILLCCLVAVDLWLNNFIWLLEGTNQLVINYVYRLIRQVLGNLSAWFFLSRGFGLYTLPMSLAVGIAFLLVYLLVLRRDFVRDFFRLHPGEAGISWRHEIMPLQWRLGISALAGFITYSLFVPMTFRFAGPVMAGRMGLSWTLVEAMTGVALLWPAVKFPAMGGLAARKDWRSLDRVTLIVGIQSLILGLLGGASLLIATSALQDMDPHLAGRFLPLMPLMFLVAAAIPKIAQSVMVYYLRAHRQEPIVKLTIVGAPLMLGAALLGAMLVGVLGLTISYAASMFFYFLPGTALILWRCRKRWHATA